MAENCKIIYKEGMGELVEKKSRFIAQIRPCKVRRRGFGFVEETERNTGMLGITVMPIFLKEKGQRLQQDAAMTENLPRQRENLCWMCLWEKD